MVSLALEVLLSSKRRVTAMLNERFWKWVLTIFGTIGAVFMFLLGFIASSRGENWWELLYKILFANSK